MNPVFPKIYSMVYLFRIDANMLSAICERFPHLNIEQAFDIRLDR